jgi:hypothetical protein
MKPFSQSCKRSTRCPEIKPVYTGRTFSFDISPLIGALRNNCSHKIENETSRGRTDHLNFVQFLQAVVAWKNCPFTGSDET